RAEHAMRHLSAAFVLLSLGASLRELSVRREIVSRAPDLDVAAIRDTTDDLRIDINVPAFRLEVRERDSVTAVYRIAVGMRDFPTPIGDFQMDHLVWNPPWTPPNAKWARGQRAQAPGPNNWMGRVKLHVT